MDLESIKAEDGAHFWNYLLKHNEVPTLLRWLSCQSENESNVEIKVFKTLPETMISLDDFVPSYTKEVLLRALVKHGYYPNFLIDDTSMLIKYLSETDRLFADVHPVTFYKKDVTEEDRKKMMDAFNIHFVRFCEENDLVLLLWKYLIHYK